MRSPFVRAIRFFLIFSLIVRVIPLEAATAFHGPIPIDAQTQAYVEAEKVFDPPPALPADIQNPVFSPVAVKVDVPLETISANGISDQDGVADELDDCFENGDCPELKRLRPDPPVIDDEESSDDDSDNNQPRNPQGGFETAAFIVMIAGLLGLITGLVALGGVALGTIAWGYLEAGMLTGGSLLTAALAQPIGATLWGAVETLVTGGLSKTPPDKPVLKFFWGLGYASVKAASIASLLAIGGVLTLPVVLPLWAPWAIGGYSIAQLIEPPAKLIAGLIKKSTKRQEEEELLRQQSEQRKERSEQRKNTSQLYVKIDELGLLEKELGSLASGDQSFDFIRRIHNGSSIDGLDIDQANKQIQKLQFIKIQTQGEIDYLLRHKEEELLSQGEAFDRNQWNQHYWDLAREGQLPEVIKADPRQQEAKETLDQLLSSPINKKQTFAQKEEEVRQATQELRQGGQAYTLEVTPTAFKADYNQIGQTYGLIAIKSKGIKRVLWRGTPELKQAPIEQSLAYVQEHAGNMPNGGTLVSVPQELRKYNGKELKGCKKEDQCLRIHEGYDIGGPRGGPVGAPQEGTVIMTGEGADNRILIYHGIDEKGNLIFSSLLHSGYCDSKGKTVQGSGILVKPGDHVQAHEVIALMGDTGKADVEGDYHTHVEWFKVPPTAKQDYQDIKQAAELLSGHPDKNTDQSTIDVDEAKATVIVIDRMLNNRAPLPKVKIKTSSGKRGVVARIYGDYYQNVWLPTMENEE